MQIFFSYNILEIKLVSSSFIIVYDEDVSLLLTFNTSPISCVFTSETLMSVCVICVVIIIK